MPKYEYIGDDERIYNEPGIGVVRPFDVRELNADPGDGRWCELTDDESERGE